MSQVAELMQVYQRSPEEYEQGLQYLLRREQGEVASQNLSYIGVDMEELVAEFPQARPLMERGWDEAYYSARVISYGQAAVESFVYGWSACDPRDSKDPSGLENAAVEARALADEEVGFMSALAVAQPLANIGPSERFKGAITDRMIGKITVPYIFASTSDAGERLIATEDGDNDIMIVMAQPSADETLATIDEANVLDSSDLHDEEREDLRKLRDALDAHFIDRLRDHEVK